MTWLRDAKLSSKLIAAFGLCALITLGVGLLGSRGVSQLSDSLKLVFSNNLVSVSKTAEAKSKAIAQLKDLYALIAAHAENDAQGVKDTIRQAMTTNQADSEKAFAIYRKTPLADDERAAGDQMERDWPIYQAQIQKVLTVLDSGNVQGARALMSGEIQQAYRTVMDELTIMVESNNRQIGEGARDAEEQEQAAITVLYIGIALAFLAALALGLFISRLISRPIATAVASAQLIAKGDLTHTIGSAARDETGQLLTALGEMQEGLKATIHQIADASNQLASAAEELNAVTEDGSRGLLRQNDEIQQAATAVTEMTSAVEEVARNAISTSEASKTASSQATDGLVQARNAVDAVNNATVEIQSSTTIVEDLAVQVRDIGKVLDVIRGIAEQTNLLALNAAIEAARAGEQGRGFAVVADEVRALAARTQSSTGEIESMIGAVRSRADQAVAAMGKSQGLVGDTQVLAKATGEALQSIATGIAQINDRNLVIASACEEQAHVAREVDRNLINIQDLSTQTAAGAHQTSASTQDLSRLATSFNDLVSRFRL
ncbi:MULTISPECIES: methyl-accepting chemotaxis protein [Pseudomonas]|uniref:Methyl-accepting chemotaxis protein n=1 Tax=Pseudomonas coleopterorum TaxID=1605838 RepID=A0ABR9BWF9_9PSED|nr:methyl-accepting chemotaxis protein [Pseudomonas coleopterorum]MBD8757158.1 methyl-accepting chemotaxis protein [Pseudomonas coleopterorum]MBD8768809.1 methyl-accepting chemotaxis protein [Pseudomonas coleopterorum]